MGSELAQFPLWDVDPVMVRICGVAIRYYGVCYFLVFAVGYGVWHWQMRRGGHALEPVTRIVLWAALGVFAGGRLGHCLLYEPDHYLGHPAQILDLRRGGIATHGSVAGLLVCLFLYARRYAYAYVEVLDRFAMSSVLGGMWVRIGNFFNGETVGREWYGPWAVRFGRHARRLQDAWEADHGPLGWVAQPLPRHPAQLYEAAGVLAIFGLLLAIDRALGERRPRGLMVGVVLVAYFAFRFAAEYWKEFQRLGELAPDPAQQVLRVVPTSGLTLGQWLSVPFFLLGVALVVWARARRLPAAAPSRFDAEAVGP